MKSMLLITLLFNFMSCIAPQKPVKEFNLPTAPRTLGEGFLYFNLPIEQHNIPLYLNEHDTLPCDTLHVRRVMEDDNIFEFKTTYLSDSLRPFVISEGETIKKADKWKNTDEDYYLHTIEDPDLIFRVLEHDSINWRIVIYEDSNSNLYKTAVIKYDSTQVDTGHFFLATSERRIAYDKLFGFESWKDRLTGGTMLYEAPYIHETMIYDMPDGVVIKAERCHAITAVEMKGEWVKIDSYDYDEKLDGWMRWRDGETLLLDADVYFE